MVEAFGMKLWVRFREQNSIWARFMLNKYCRKVAPSRVSLSWRQSVTWKRMAKVGSNIHGKILWALGDGDINFWEVETREHLFLQGKVATQVWDGYSSWFPNLPRWNGADIDLKKRILFWHNWLSRPTKAHVSSVLPCLILWTLWSERSNHIHRGTRFTSEIVFNRIKQYLQQLISAGRLGKEQWSGCETDGRFDTAVWKEKPRKQVQMVRWIPPEENWLKLNVHGLHNAAGSGAGGILRDGGGNFVRGFKARISASSQLDAWFGVGKGERTKHLD